MFRLMSSFRIQRFATVAVVVASTSFLVKKYQPFKHQNTLHCEQVQVQETQQSTTYQAWKNNQIGHYGIYQTNTQSQLLIENRLRMYSHPLKVFQYFASVGQAGKEFFMTPADFIRSMLPYIPLSSSLSTSAQNSSQDYTRAVQDIARMADTDGDGLISFEEYMFFLTLLSTPETLFELAFKVFDTDGNEQLDHQEFSKVISSHSTAVSQRMGSLETGVPKVTDNGVQLSGLMAHMFGKHGQNQLSYTDFTKILRKLQMDLLRCEFYQYPVDSGGTISAQDFACVVLTYSHPTRTQEFMKRLETVPIVESKDRITFDQFVAFDKVTDNMPIVKQAMSLFGQVQSASTGVTRPQLKRVFKLATNADISDTQLSVLFHLFDDNGDQLLNGDELVDALKGRSFRGLDQPRDVGIWRRLEKMWSCATQEIN